MRREVVIAIILGVGLGILVAFGLWRANLSFAPKEKVEDIINEITETPQPAVQSDLIITQPEDLSIITQEKVILKGAATPNAIVTILAPLDQIIVQAGKDGSFEAEIELSGGSNEIIIKSFNEEGQDSTQKLTLVYSTEFEQ